MPTNINSTVVNLVKRFDKLKSNRGTIESHWQDCADYCLPRKATITEQKTAGHKVSTTLYDSTGIQSAQVFAAGLTSYLTNPASKWFALDLDNKELKEGGAVKVWLKTAEDKIFDTLNSCNFNQEIFENYLDLGVFGTGSLYEEEDPETIIRFHTRPLSEIFIVENERKRIDTLFRHFTFTVRQAYMKWGGNAGTKVIEAYEANKLEDDMEFLHIVLPRGERDVKKKDNRNLPFASLYVEPKTKKILSEGGYAEFPFFIPRLTKVSGETYGRSPAMTTLPDLKTLNAMAKTILIAGQKLVNPPLQVPHDGFILPIKTTPGDINYRLGNAEDEIKPLYQPNIHNLPIGMEMEEQKRTSIKRAFFVDLFLLLAARTDTMTATEVAERVNEKMLILGPMLGRLMSELLDPIITRTFNILLRLGLIPPPPPELQGQDYKVKYISPLAKAQRASEMQSMSQMLVVVGEMAAFNPAVLDNIDYDKVVKEMAEITNVSGIILRSDEEVKEIREARQQQLEVQQTLEAAQQVADTAKAGASAEKDLTEGAK